MDRGREGEKGGAGRGGQAGAVGSRGGANHAYINTGKSCDLVTCFETRDFTGKAANKIM